LNAGSPKRADSSFIPTLVRALEPGRVGMKDESARFGLPAFKVLGASWAVERMLRERPGVHTIVAASAGNHGRAVARVAAERGLRCRIFLPARAAPARRAAIEAEGDVGAHRATAERALRDYLSVAGRDAVVTASIGVALSAPDRAARHGRPGAPDVTPEAE